MNKNSIIPDKLFHNLWKAALEYSSREEYVNSFTLSSSDSYINFERKYDISMKASYHMLEEIYDKANLPFTDLLKLTGKTQAELADIFCIPKRNIQNWCYEKSRCPEYIVLMILRYFKLLELGHGIYVQADKVQSTILSSSSTQRKANRAYRYKKEVEEKEDDLTLRNEFLSIDEILARYDELDKKHESVKKTGRDILAETDYLKYNRNYQRYIENNKTQ